MRQRTIEVMKRVLVPTSIEVPGEAIVFPQARSTSNIIKKEVALASRSFCAREYPSNVAEPGRAFVNKKGWSSI